MNTCHILHIKSRNGNRAKSYGIQATASNLIFVYVVDIKTKAVTHDTINLTWYHCLAVV